MFYMLDLYKCVQVFSVGEGWGLANITYFEAYKIIVLKGWKWDWLLVKLSSPYKLSSN